jgi:hypothetical protein
MLNLLLASLLLPAQAPDFNALAKARNAEGLLQRSGPAVRALGRPFNFLRVNGPYDTGRHGWTAIPLHAPTGDKYIVFSTKITSEDYGEFVFATDGKTITKFIPEPDTLGFRIAHQKLTVRFDLPAKTAILSSSVNFRRTGAPRKGFIVRMSPQYRVSAVADSSGKPVKFVQAGGVVWLPAPAATAFTYKLHYKGVVDLPHYAGSITTREAMLTNDYWYPMIARLPATYEATIQVPKGWTGVAQGELVKDVAAGQTRSMTWRMDLPVVYWSLSAAAYKTFSQVLGGRRYTVWSLSMTPEEMRMQTEINAPVLEFFDSIHPYPFSYWGVVDSPQYGSGALEAYSFATYGQGWLPDEDAHEPAHTWWGGIINNTYMRSLWNESFASFCEGFYNREAGIGNRPERRLAFVADASPEPSYAQASLAKSGVFDGPFGGALGYGKGAKVLQMLEAEISTAAMTAAMRHWLKNHPKGEPGEWEHFEKSVNAVTELPMTRFFDQWVRRPGWADFDVQNVSWQNGKVTGEAVFRGEPYSLLCEVLVQEVSGERNFHKIRLEPANGRAPFEILSPAKPAIVSFDPYRKLLRRSHPNEAPLSFSGLVRGFKRFTEPGREGWMTHVSPPEKVDALPSSLNGLFIVGSPETLPIMKELCQMVGFTVRGDKLTYDGTTIDLDEGGAVAVVDLAEGGKCLIGLGATRREPSIGRARLALVDRLGRFLRGQTEPKTSGFLTFRL